MPLEVPSYREHDDLSTEVEDLRSRVNSLDTETDNLTTAVNDLTTAVNNLQDRVSALESEHSGTEPEPSVLTRVGIGAGWRSGYSSWTEVINAAENVSGRTMQVRRVFDSGVPSSFDSSGLRHDNGVRDQVWSFKPDTGTSVSELVSLFESIPDRTGVWVTPYHEPRDNMDAATYHQIYDSVYEAYQQFDDFAGIGPILTNWGIDFRNELEYVQPEKATFLGVDHYAQLEDTLGTAPASAMSTAIDYANTHGLQFGVGEYGVDINRSGSRDSLADWIVDFDAVPEPVWLCYFHADVNGSWWLDNDQRFIDAYQYLWDHFNGV